jgi:hypothetical protein
MLPTAVFLVVWVVPKKLPIFYFFLSFWNRSISTREALIYSMLISVVNDMRTFVFWAIMASFRKNDM